MASRGTLFPEWDRPPAPLAERIRPATFVDIAGHEALIGPDGWLRKLAERGRLPHLVLWGPPGCGKTTLAGVLAACSDATLVHRSAVDIGVREVRDIVTEAMRRYRTIQRRTVFFLDEIHRFNKAQQDALLGDLERGTVTLIGATTENPAFSLNNALLSRVRVVELEPLDVDALGRIIERGAAEMGIDVTEEARKLLIAEAGGDARALLGLLETAIEQCDDQDVLDADAVAAVLRNLHFQRHDRQGDQHYAIVSAWIKSMRGSDVDAALYWAARLWEGGDDRRFLFRRLIIFASEDVGNADPRALTIAVAAAEAFERVGEAEGWIPFAQAVSWLAAAEKSNASYLAFQRAREAARRWHDLPVPAHLRNASNHLARDRGDGRDYQYPHDFPDGFAPQQRYLPEGLPAELRFYEPVERGAEADILRRMARRRARKET